jgi:hypothetical protein
MIFRDVVGQIVPFGDFQRKDKAIKIVKNEIKDPIFKEKMLELLNLIPQKKSLLLAQEALNYERIDKVMEIFRIMELSPITISNRHSVEKLEGIHRYL